MTVNRSARQHRYAVPSRDDVCQRIEQLLSGELSRDDVSRWAAEYLVFDDPQIYPEITDPRLHQALDRLSGADAPSTDRDYLYGEDDFADWLAELKAG